MKRYVLFVLILLLAACGGNEEDLLPTPTVNPLAFFAPTPFSPGTQQNPLQLVFVPPDPETADQAATTLQTELRSRSGLVIDIVGVISYGEALSMLCDYNDGDRFAAPWLSGPAAVIALERECGDVALMATRGGRSTIAGELVSTSGLGINSLPGRTFCRRSVNDYYSWVLPTLAMQTRNIDPTDLERIDDIENYDLLFGEIAAGTCDVTGIPAGLLETEAFADYSQTLRAGYTTPPMPYGVLVYPPELLLADREALTQAFIQVVGMGAAVTEEPAANPNATPPAELVELNEVSLTTNQAALLALLGADGVMPATADDLTVVQEFMAATGIDFAGLGR